MSGLKFDPEFLQAMLALQASSTVKIPTSDDLVAFREFQHEILKHNFDRLPEQPEIQEERHEMVSLDGTKIEVRRFSPPGVRDAKEPQRGVIYLHGGGFIAGTLDVFQRQIATFVARTGVQFFAVEYRLAPEHPAPAAVEDVYAAVRWVQANAVTLNTDPARLAILGISAGGGLAFGAALLARDRDLQPPLARLVAFYPMLDDRTTIAAEDPLSKFLVWSGPRNDMAWTAYLGGREREARATDVSIYAAPSRAEDVSGLPPSYIDVGGLDLFRDECIEFAGKLVKANVNVEFKLYPGLPHGWDGIAQDIQFTKEAWVSRTRVLTDF